GAASVVYVTGKRKMTDLQGRDLYKKMPICLTLYMIGGFSISAVPLFNGFISKTMIIASCGEVHRPIIHLLLHLASIGTFLHTGLKLPYGIWFGNAPKNDKREKIEVKEPPLNMLVAMGFTAFLCIFTGIFPKVLYNLLPNPVHFHPYEPFKVVAMLQLLLLTAAAFWVFKNKLGGEATVSMDTDWFYRKGGRLFAVFCAGPLSAIRSNIQVLFSKVVIKLSNFSRNPVLLPSKLLKFPALMKSDDTNFNEDSYRGPVGVGVIFVLILFLFYSIIFLL
ncbi:MAG: proton-conducting transporter membrane subunit, partial [bacterium]